MVVPGLGQDTIVSDTANIGKPTATTILGLNRQQGQVAITYTSGAQSTPKVTLQRNQVSPAFTDILLDIAILAAVHQTNEFIAAGIAIVADHSD